MSTTIFKNTSNKIILEKDENGEDYCIGAFGIRITKSMIENALSIPTGYDDVDNLSMSIEEFEELAKLVGFSDDEIKIMQSYNNE